MGEWLRLAAILALAGALLTVAAVAAARLMTEERRLARAFRKGLGAAPDASIVAGGRGAGLSLQTRRLTVAWDGGRWRLDYGLDELVGGELEFDGEVVARAVRDEERQRLARGAGGAREVVLRLLFDDPSHPDFELPLWPPKSRKAAEGKGARAAAAEANRWLARIEAVLRRAHRGQGVGRPRAQLRSGETHRPLEADLFDEEAFVDET